MNSNISKTEQKKNPQAVLDVLNWFDNNASKQRPSSPKYMTASHNNATNSGKIAEFLNYLILLIYLSIYEHYSEFWWFILLLLKKTPS